MKHFVCTIVFFASCLCLPAQTAWNGSTSPVAAVGTTYVVTTAEQLAWIASQSQTDDFEGYTIRLDADIDLGGVSDPKQRWTAIGNASTPFQGELDGNNHIIRNMYIFESGAGAMGLIAETGVGASIHNLALAQGLINTEATHNVGSIVGINRGMVHHCFNMVEIAAKNGDNIGGLVGTNEGVINYSYNNGIITNAHNQVGGLVGWNKNTAELDHCYNMAYCKGSGMTGALFGKNEADKGHLTNLRFDQQTSLFAATGAGSADPTIDNSGCTVAYSHNMLKIYEGDAEWTSIESQLQMTIDTLLVYPQLTCFVGTDASLLSAYGIFLDTELPTERADGVGTPNAKNERRQYFGLSFMDGTDVEWFSPAEDVIKIKQRNIAEVMRPCGNQEVILTVSLGSETKQIYTNVKGFDPFDAGELIGGRIVCWGENGVSLKSLNKEGTEATGGKDDEQQRPKAYEYMIIRDTVYYIDDVCYIEPIDTFYMSHEQYGKWQVPTDVPGDYAFERYVHDAQCKTTFTRSPGYLYLTVREAFDPGELYTEPDTVYGLPSAYTVLSKADASGGSKEYEYLWSMEQSIVDYVTGDTVPGTKANPLYDENGNVIKTNECPQIFTGPGEYVYKRRVSEKQCQQDAQESTGRHRVVVFDYLHAGSITPMEQELCTPAVSDTIFESEAPTGGNGRYSYRWLCNGSPIPDSDTAALCLANVTMSNGNTYVFRRQVKDDTGLMDWTTSDDSVRLVVYAAYKAGAVENRNEHVCYTRQEEQSLLLQIPQQSAPEGDGEFIYCWLLYKGEETTPHDTIFHNESMLDTTILLSSYNLEIPSIITVRRAVLNTLCPSEWKLSANSAVWQTGYSETKEEVVSPCAADLPYRDTYQYQDGHTQQYSLADGASVTFNDLTPDGCPLTRTITCRAYKRPKVAVRPIVSVCQTDTALVLSYTVEEGKPNTYDITFSAEAEAAGFVSRTGEPLPSSGHEIRVPMPTNAPLGRYSFSVLFYTASTSGTPGCVGEILSMTFSLDMDGYVHRKWNDVVFVDNSDKNCEPNCEDDLTFVSYQWYKDGELIPGATEQSYYEEGGLNGYYQVLMTADDGTVYRSCEYEMRPITALDEAYAPVHLYPVPTLAGSMMQIQAEESGTLYFYNLQGVCCGQHAIEVGTRSVHAPDVSGIYLARFVSANEQLFTCKLIVL